MWNLRQNFKRFKIFVTSIRQHRERKKYSRLIAIGDGRTSAGDTFTTRRLGVSLWNYGCPFGSPYGIDETANMHVKKILKKRYTVG